MAGFLETSWPDAVVAVGGVTMITVIVAVAIWQAFASWRAKMSVAREEAYRQLAEESAAMQRQVGDSLALTTRKLEDLDHRTAELERLLKEVG
jgi:hypothetical protein